MSVLNHLGREGTAKLSRRLWILGVLLLVLCVLALVQYRWINQLARAERERARTNLDAALAGVESDFDVEITRAYAVFELPVENNSDYAKRYIEWLQHAPFPELIRGVYIARAGQANSSPEAVVSGAPDIPLSQWQREAAKLALLHGGIAISATGITSAAGFQLFSGGGMAATVRFPDPMVTIGGNPAFVFPITPLPPGVAPGVAAQISIARRLPVSNTIVGVRRRVGPTQWAVVVLDAQYLGTTFLPRLVKLHFPASDYEILVIRRGASAPSRVVFRSEPSLSESRFEQPDGTVDLLRPRLDCFPRPASMGVLKTAGIDSTVHVVSDDSVSQLLAQRPPACGIPSPASPDRSDGMWEMMVRYRAGSLDQAISSFRDRNLLLSASVLLVLALGIAMLFVLAERARALAEMQAEFALGVSHELRTPLTVIRLAADNLRKGIVERPEQTRKYGDIIQAHASELSNMIEETLAFGQLQSGTLLRQRALVDPGQLVKEALTDSECALRDLAFEVELYLASDLPLVSVDARLARKCLENLIQNVVKYAATGRWMAVRTTKTGPPDAQRVQISVEDRGPGISAADLPHVFKPFYRGRQGGGSRFPGVGLGLTLVKRVVEAHHGTVEVETSKSGGTKFKISLPAYPPPPDAPKAV